MLIVEGILSTLRANGTAHLAAMGARLVDGSFNRFVLRPFFDTQSYQNLTNQREGVFHVTDDVLLIARLVVGHCPECCFYPPRRVRAPILADACRAFEFQVVTLDSADELRASVTCRTLHCWNMRPFLGFNRARHALLELAITATRLHLLPKDNVLDELRRAELLTQKTGGELEQETLRVLRDHVLRFYENPPLEEPLPPG